MSRRRVTGRFYFLLLIIVGVAAFFAWREFFPRSAHTAVIGVASASDSRSMEGVIIRDEPVTSYEGTGRVSFVANEGDMVKAGDEVAYIYASGYSEKEMLKLEDVRQNIREYHQEILSNIVDQELQRLDNNVTSRAVELKTLINHKSSGSLIRLVDQLEDAMLARQDYLSQNRREDPKLNQLYEEERSRENNISSWQTVQTASGDGMVSFYLDGCESFLSIDNLHSLTPEDIRAILNGATPKKDDASRLLQPVFRLVNTDKWYVMVLCGDPAWTPVTGQEFSFQFSGYEDLIYSGIVTKIQKTETETMALLEVTDPMGPMVNLRSGQVVLGANLQGLLVPASAIVNQGGQMGVLLSDVPGGTFIPVNVLSRGEAGVLISPLIEGSLNAGQTVLLQ
jgi:hypothetical protein